MASKVKVDTIEQQGSSGIVLSHDVKLASGTAIKNAAGTALLTEAGVLGSSVTGQQYSLLGTYVPSSKMGSDHKLIIGFNGETGLRAGGTTGAFETDRYAYVVGLTGVIPGADDVVMNIQYYSLTAGAYLAGAVYEIVSYGYYANSSANPGTVEGFEHNTATYAQILGGGDWRGAGSDGSVSAELKFWNPAPSVSTPTKQMTGTVTYFDTSTAYSHATVGVGITTSDQIGGLQIWFGTTSDVSVGRVSLYEVS